jgi:hypothetical protein
VKSSTFSLALLLVLVLAPAGPAAGEEAQRGAAEAALDLALRHGVTVGIRFRRDLEGEESNAFPPDPQGREESYRFWRMSYVVPGFVVRDRRTVLVSDLWVSPTALAEVEIRAADGRTVPGRLRAFLVPVGAVLLEADADLPLEPLAFGADALPGAPLLCASLAEGAQGFEAWVAARGPARRLPVGHPGPAGYGLPHSAYRGLEGTGEGQDRTVDLVVATPEGGSATPVGFRLGADLAPGDRWRAPFVLGAREFPFAALRRMAERLGEGASLHRVKVAYRTQSRHDQERTGFFLGAQATVEREFWGAAVSPDTLVVPAAMAEDDVRKIIQVRLADDEGPGRKAEYAGRVHGFEAFLVKVEGGGLVPLPKTPPPLPALDEAILVHRVAWRGGARRDQVDYDRVTGRGRGYGDRWFLAVERGVPAGSFLRDVEGRLLGFSALLNPEDRERRLGEEERPGRPAASPFREVALLFADFGSAAALAANPDTRVMPQAKADAERGPWLGVETDEIDEGVADLLGVSGPTRDGRRGLIVIHVYEGSPAERAALAEDDVLLSVRRLTAPAGPPIDLRGGRSASPFPRSFPWDDAAPAPWRSRQNALVRLLKSWGLGTEYELEWLRAGEVRRTRLTVEAAPPDFASAPRIYDDATGLEVRDLTYEVKAVLRLPAAATGVVIGRVEQGSAAAQARLAANELILELSGAPVADAADFERLLQAARDAGIERVRLVVRRLGRSRLVDLPVSGSGRARRDGAGPGEGGGGGDDGDGDGDDGDGDGENEDGDHDGEGGEER